MGTITFRKRNNVNSKHFSCNVLIILYFHEVWWFGNLLIENNAEEIHMG